MTKSKFRFHVLGVPHTVSNKEFTGCAYTQKVVNFCKMMTRRGHHVIHYGHEDSDVICSEHVTVTRNSDLLKAYGNYDWRKGFFKFDVSDAAYTAFYANAIREIGLRSQPHDFLLPFFGHGHRKVCDTLPQLITVEPGIGYAEGHWARWKVFESYAIYHAYCGLRNVGACHQSWYDVVIPNYFDIDDFEYSDTKDDYFLYLGRVYSGKGVHIAFQVAETLGLRLVVAGQRDPDFPIPSSVEFVGYANAAKRKVLMRDAKASFIPSMYLEPFGGVQVENLLSGTPTITTDWGAFVENNIHGVTGYRCRTFDDFILAAQNIGKISNATCRQHGLQFTLESVAPRYERFFADVMDVYTGNGWYERRSESAPTSIANVSEQQKAN